MIPADVFSLANMVAMFMWIIMIFFSKWKVTRVLIDFKIVPILLSVLYAIYIVTAILKGLDMDFGSLQSVMQLFTFENAVLAGWLHYLAFDLVLGMWMIDENRVLKIHPVMMGLCLISTFILGPIGFLLFMGVSAFKKRVV